ncbi:hypothetical protein [Microbacterium sp.]|uniref:hypothetical protein n=1 Tax=Microbacterium sp. TaxID=51671 RepID=UPI0032429545
MARDTIKGRPIQGRIDQLLDAGTTYKEIRTLTGLSVPAIGRYAISRKSQLAKVADGEPAVTDVILRLIDAADDARELRRQSRVVGTPVQRARAIKIETELLVRLIDTLGIDDTSVSDFVGQVEALLPVLRTFAVEQPENARHLIEALAADTATRDLGTALVANIKEQA